MMHEMLSKARGKINKVLCGVITMVTLVRWCSCRLTCSQLVSADKNNATDKPGIPVFHGIRASQTEIKIWLTTQTNKLQCCATGNPDPEIIWYRNGDVYTFATTGRAVINNGGQSVSLNDIRFSDAGNYTCLAKNVLGNISHSFLVKVKDMFLLQKPVVMLEPSPWKTVAGNNVTISCTIAKSAKPPLVMWLCEDKNNTQPCQGNRYNVALSKAKEKQTWLSKLTILNVTTFDEGNYTCVAKNGAGSGKAAQQKGTLILIQDRSSKARAQEENESPIQSSLIGGLTALVVVSILSILTIAFLRSLWKRKSTWLRHWKHFPMLHDQQSFTNPYCSHDHNPLLLDDGEIHVEIPKENLQLLRRGPGTSQDAVYDVFLSYSSLDRDFVKNCLYAELTATHSVCIDFKDFEAGLFITDNIANSVFKSRKTILVVTRNFLKGVWTFFEMQLAQGRLSDGHDVLILVVVEDIPVDELPRPLQHYRKMKTYLEYYNEDVKPHFWDRLRSAIGPSLSERNQEPLVNAGNRR